LSKSSLENQIFSFNEIAKPNQAGSEFLVASGSIKYLSNQAFNNSFFRYEKFSLLLALNHSNFSSCASHKAA
jgi:hypothetical protein